MNMLALCSLVVVAALPGEEAYLRGMQAERAARYGAAATAFDQCAAADEILAPYAKVRVAYCRLTGGDEAGGVSAFRALLDADPDGPWKRMAQALLAGWYMARERHAEAAPWFAGALSFDPKGRWSDQHQWRAAISYLQTPDRQAEGAAHFYNVIDTTWWRTRRGDAALQLTRSTDPNRFEYAAWAAVRSGDAQAARTFLLTAMPPSGIWPQVATTVLSDVTKWDASGRAVMAEAVQQHKDSRLPRVVLACLVEGLGAAGNPAAADVCSVMMEAFPQSPETVLALWSLGKRLRDAKKTDEAIAQFDRLARHAPNHSLADDALLGMATLYRDTSRTKEAVDTFLKTAATYPGGEFAGRALLWAAEGYETLGDVKKAAFTYERVAADMATRGRLGDYHVHRAIQRLFALNPKHKAVGEDVPLGTAGKFLHTFDRPKDKHVPLPDSLAGSPGFRRLAFFAAHGLEEAEWEAVSLTRTLRMKLYAEPIYRFLGEAGLAATAMDCAEALEWGCKNDRFTPARLRVGYPLAYWDLVAPICKKAGIDPLLALSVARQESTFRPNLTSHAGAAGVMQLMPGTAEWLAKVDSGITPEQARELFHPGNSFQLGAAYLARMLERSNGNVVFALASYNAGPGNCDKWRTRWPNVDMETFIENIPFNETRNYVKAVLGNYAAYRTLYGPEALEARPEN